MCTVMSSDLTLIVCFVFDVLMCRLMLCMFLFSPVMNILTSVKQHVRHILISALLLVCVVNGKQALRLCVKLCFSLSSGSLSVFLCCCVTVDDNSVIY